jgi:hypothetical protein
MRGKDFNAGLRGGLFEAQHYERMGAAVWLYGWLILRQTRQEGTLGFVLGGKPVTYREIEEETGFGRKTLERWMRVLRRNGYIETRAVASGIIVKVTKAKKFSCRFGSNRAQSQPPDSGDSHLRSRGPIIEETSRQIRGFTAVDSTDYGRVAAGIGSGFIGAKKSTDTTHLGNSEVFHTKSSDAAENNSPPNTPRQSGEATARTEMAPGYGRDPEWSDPGNERSSGPYVPSSPYRDWRAWREELVRRELRVGAGPEVRHRDKPAGNATVGVEQSVGPDVPLEAQSSLAPPRCAQGNLFDSAQDQARQKNSLDELGGGKKTAAGAA